jgi:hypothetical protein
LTVVSPAIPPLEIVSQPPELTVVVVTIPLSSTVIASFERMMPSLDSPLEMMYAILRIPFPFF